MGKQVVSGFGAQHDGVDTTSASPIKIGGQAISFDGTDPLSVAEGDRSHCKLNLQGGLFVDISNPFAWHTSMSFAAATTAAAVVAAPGAGLSLHLTDFVVSAQTTGANFIVREDTTTVIHVQFDMGAADHFNHSYRTPLRFTANKPLQLTVTTTNTTFSVSGYTAP